MTLKTWLLVATLGVLAGSAAQAQEEGDPRIGERLASTCMGCHAVEGARNAYPSYRVPKLGGQSEAYLINALKAYRSGERSHGTMQAQAGGLTDEEIRHIAAYFSEQR